MKELSIEEKAKAYDEALSVARKTHQTQPMYRDWLEKMFPELKESEDEKIRCTLINHFKTQVDLNRTWNGLKNTDILAWLEKHADNVEPKFKVEKDKWYVCISQYCNCIEGRNYKASLDGRIIDDYGTEYDMHNDAYRWFRPWTIKDAKDGEVLCCESGWTCIFKALDNRTNTFSSYCFMDSDKWFCNTGSECHTLDKAFIKAYNGEIYPATPKQRNLLFKKMHEVGYEWNVEKKELIKITDKSAEKIELDKKFTPIESALKDLICDVDNSYTIEQVKRFLLQYFKDGYGLEHTIESITDWLKDLRGRVQPQPKQKWSEEDEHILKEIISFIPYHLTAESYTLFINWLKSLRPQSQWKPSDEQMEYLAKAITTLGNEGDNKTSAILYELRTDLKKLKDEK